MRTFKFIILSAICVISLLHGTTSVWALDSPSIASSIAVAQDSTGNGISRMQKVEPLYGSHSSALYSGMPLPPTSRLVYAGTPSHPVGDTDTTIVLEGGIFAFIPLADTAKRLVRWRMDAGAMEAKVWDIDTSFRQAHRFIPGVPTLTPYESLGISFGPVQSCDYFARAPIYNAMIFGQVPMQPYLQHTHTLFSSRRPFSRFETTYNFRTTKAELWASWLFTQNVNPYWNIALEFFHGDETSGMQTLNSRFNGGQLMLWHAKGPVFGSLSVGYRSVKLVDNGGILHPSWLTDTVLKVDVLPVRFPQTQITDRTIDGRLHFEYAIARYSYDWADSSRRGYTYREPALSLFTTHKVMSASHAYQNSHISDTLELTRGLGPRTFSDAMSHDSVDALRYEGRLGVIFRPSRRKGLRWLPRMSGWIGYRAHRGMSATPFLYLQGYKPSVSQFLFAGAAINAKLGPVGVQGNGYLFYRQRSITDAFAKAEVQYVLLKDTARTKLLLRGAVQWQSRGIPGELKKYTSNEYNWAVKGKSPYLHYVDASASLDAPWWGGRYGVRARFYKNYVYFDAQGIPARSARQVVSQAFVEQRLYRWGVTLEMRLMMQRASDANTLHLPLFAGSLLVGYEYELVKNALTARLALETTYTTSYRGDIYNAALGVYHLQNDFPVGNYPNIDGIVSLKWKTVNVFVTVSHAAQGLFGRGQFASTLYPLRNRAVRFGLEWYFR